MKYIQALAIGFLMSLSSLTSMSHLYGMEPQTESRDKYCAPKGPEEKQNEQLSMLGSRRIILMTLEILKVPSM